MSREPISDSQGVLVSTVGSLSVGEDKVSVDGVRKEKERLTTDHQPIPGPYLSFHEKWRQAVSVFFFLFRLSRELTSHGQFSFRLNGWSTTLVFFLALAW